MSLGSASLTRRLKRLGRARWIRCRRVRPAPAHGRRRPFCLSRRSRASPTRSASRIARSSSPCIVRAFFCTCQPLYLVPAYSMVTLQASSSGRAFYLLTAESRLPGSPSRHQLCTAAAVVLRHQLARTLSHVTPRRMSQVRRLPVGAELQPDGSTHFRVWCPRRHDVRARD